MMPRNSLWGIICAVQLFYCGNPDTPRQPDSTLNCSDSLPLHSGEATYYDFADGGGNCSFPPTPDDLMVGAMNHSDYEESYACGSCVHINGPNSSIDIRIVDQCPECKPGDIDLSPLAFSHIAALERGRVPITWRVIPCPVTGPIIYHFKEGSNPWWIALQIRNHRYPIAKMEFLSSSGDFIGIPRSTYNYFVATEGLGTGPFIFRVTDLFDHQLIDTIMPPATDSGEVAGVGQFPLCD